MPRSTTAHRMTSRKKKSPSYRVVVLGAGRPGHGSLPPAIVHTNKDKRVLDWLLAAFSDFKDRQVCFVGGFMALRVIESFPEVYFYVNREWETTGSGASLALAPLSSLTATYVCYSDIVFRESLVRQMETADADLVIAVDTQWRTRYAGRSRSELESAEKVILSGAVPTRVNAALSVEEADAEFAGVIRFSAKATQRVERLLQDKAFPATSTIPDILEHLLQSGMKCKAVDTQGEWAELDAPQDLARFVLGTKAESLERLKPLIRKGQVPDLLSFTQKDWDRKKSQLIAALRKQFQGANVIVRSSSLAEDSWTQSLAGQNESIASVPTDGSSELEEAIARVLGSYERKAPKNQVLIQKMVERVVMSGVILTRTPSQRSPYYVICFDSTTQRTNTVTSGTGQDIRTVYLHRGSHLIPSISPDLARVVQTVKEIEELVGHDSLDIEFAVTDGDPVHILQVRPISVGEVSRPVDDAVVLSALNHATQWYRDFQQPGPFLLGNAGPLSVMTDWNPAEIIGTKPSELSFSLYRWLITDDTWAAQRAEYGYRDVRPCNLIIDLLGHPYVDVRASFNSFIPAKLPETLATKLVDHYLGVLGDHPHLHDKVEFEILFTCLGFDFEERKNRLKTAGFTDAEIDELRRSLLEITRQGVKRVIQDHAELIAFQKRYQRIRDSGKTSLELAFSLLEDVRRIGALNFSHLARGGFVAITLLRSLESVGCTTAQDTESYLASLNTVSSRFQRDAFAVKKGTQTWDAFVDAYGHLRPGTYDITSLCYAEDPERYLNPVVEGASAPRTPPTDPWNQELRAKISKHLERIGLGITVHELDAFCRLAIEDRELSKFVFTRNVSAALNLISEFGRSHLVSREELKHVPILDLLRLREPGTGNIFESLREMVARGKEKARLSQAVCLPTIMFSPQDCSCFEQLKAVPNYVTRKRVCALRASLVPDSKTPQELRGKIVIIPSADPGFDWLFAEGIAGLVTMYGGSNSHMTIRAAEFQLPAAIGVGELIYNQIAGARILELDCASQRINVVSRVETNEPPRSKVA